MNILDVAWAAGIIDGEGCISIIRVPPTKKNGCRTVQYKMILKVTMGHRPTVERLLKIFGSGSRQDHVARTEKVNASYSWICQSVQVKKVLDVVRKYLFTKAEEADVALEFLSLPKFLVGGRGGNPVMPKSMERRREVLYWRLRKLKPRWRFYLRKMREVV